MAIVDIIVGRIDHNGLCIPYILDTIFCSSYNINVLYFDISGYSKPNVIFHTIDARFDLSIFVKMQSI